VTCYFLFFFFSSRRRHTRSLRDWSSDVCSSDLAALALGFCLFVCWRVGAARQEEAEARLEHLLVRPVVRWRWLTATFLLDLLARSEEHTSELQSRRDLVCRLLLEKKKKRTGGVM